MSTPPSLRCETCKSIKENARNLVVFIDGTSNKPGDEETSIVKLYDIVADQGCPEVEQRKRYLAGIGAYEADNLSLLDRLGKKISNGLEMAFARNVKENVKSAYGWLADEYQKGDQVYLFGFSRGAYQVRALASMIHEVTRSDQVNRDNDLINKNNKAQIDRAYRNYCCINPNDPETRKAAIEFKKRYCWHGVRIHFVGVWDTVSSLGLLRQDVHITASSSVTNACHFRHALALDECRVKFMPEYFLEVNAYHMCVESPRSSDSDVKEVWFAGYHSDDGGASRRGSDEDDPHAGKVPFLWMKQEAAFNGLVFKATKFSWDPRDVYDGRVEEMKWYWKFVENLPIRHQVGFNGTGKYAARRHQFHPRLVIPHQYVHPSILSADVYAPRAVLSAGVAIPTVPRIISWAIEPLYEGAATLSTALTSLPRDPQTALRSLEKMSFLLGSSNGQIRTRVELQWSEVIVRTQCDFDKFALAVIYVACGFSMSDELAVQARDSPCAIFYSSPHQLAPRGILDILRLSTRDKTLRQHFIAHDEVIKALVAALDRTAKDGSDDWFVVVMECLCYLIDDGDRRDYVVNQLTTRSTVKTSLSSILEMRAPSCLTASLKMIASLGRYKSTFCEALAPKIVEIAKRVKGPVGSAAVEVLIELNRPREVDRAIHFSNFLGYFNSALPRLDAEIGNTPQTGGTNALPLDFPVGGLKWLDEALMQQFMQSMNSPGVQRRTAATLTLLKLCRHPAILDRCLQNKVPNIFLKQIQRKETSLLAVYALQTLLTYSEQTSDVLDVPHLARLVTIMFDKGWFDDAVGRVEGSEIFRNLMSFDNLKRQVINVGILTTIITKFASGERHGVRMSLICLDILGDQVAEELEIFVGKNLAYLSHGSKTQMKGAKVLSALALTKVGEDALRPRVVDIVRMLLPHQGQSPVPRSQLFAPTAALHNLCKNETLRKVIEETPEYAKFKGLRPDSALYPSPIRQRSSRTGQTRDPMDPVEVVNQTSQVGRQPRMSARTENGREVTLRRGLREEVVGEVKGMGGGHGVRR